MNCTNCGHELPDSALFCGYCGVHINIDQGPANSAKDKAIHKKKKPLLGLWLALGLLLVITVFLLVSGYRRTHPPDFPLTTPYTTENHDILNTQEPSPLIVEDTEPTPYVDVSLIPDVLIELIGIPNIITVDHFDSLTNRDWNSSDNVKLVNMGDNRLEVPGISGYKGYICSPEFEQNQGILTKIRMSSLTPYMEFFIFQNKWNTPEYKRFGGAIYNSHEFETTIWEGNDNSLSNQYFNKRLYIMDSVWYGLFIGQDDNGKFLFFIWKLDDPRTQTSYTIAKDKDWSTGKWISCFQIDTGPLHVDDYSIVSFDHIK